MCGLCNNQRAPRTQRQRGGGPWGPGGAPPFTGSGARATGWLSRSLCASAGNARALNPASGAAEGAAGRHSPGLPRGGLQGGLSRAHNRPTSSSRWGPAGASAWPAGPPEDCAHRNRLPLGGNITFAHPAPPFPCAAHLKWWCGSSGWMSQPQHQTKSEVGAE